MLQQFSSCLLPLLNYLTRSTEHDNVNIIYPAHHNGYRVPVIISKCITVSALVCPSQDVFNLLAKVAADVEGAKHYSSTMASLQKDVPVLFKLTSSVHGYDTYTNPPQLHQSWSLLNTPACMRRLQLPVLKVMHALIPHYLSFQAFLQYNLGIRIKLTKSQNRKLFCTKNSSGHPTLLPGIFTLYCPHGETIVIQPIIIIQYMLQLEHMYNDRYNYSLYYKY